MLSNPKSPDLATKLVAQQRPRVPHFWPNLPEVGILSWNCFRPRHADKQIRGITIVRDFDSIKDEALSHVELGFRQNPHFLCGHTQSRWIGAQNH
jgi:hypothetical protein